MEYELFYTAATLKKIEEGMPFFASLDSHTRFQAWTKLQAHMVKNFLDEFPVLDDGSESEAEYLESMWDTWCRVSAYAPLEEDLVEGLDDEIQAAFHSYYGRDFQQIQAKRAKQSEQPARYEKVSQARGEGKRISKRAGNCYVCGQYLQRGEAELLLASEVPEHFRESGVSDESRWVVRCLTAPCSDVSNGSRSREGHIEVAERVPNKTGERCWTCGLFVGAGEGIIIHRDLLPPHVGPVSNPKWSPKRTYFVQCGD